MLLDDEGSVVSVALIDTAGLLTYCSEPYLNLYFKPIFKSWNPEYSPEENLHALIIENSRTQNTVMLIKIKINKVQGSP